MGVSHVEPLQHTLAQPQRAQCGDAGCRPPAHCGMTLVTTVDNSVLTCLFRRCKQLFTLDGLIPSDAVRSRLLEELNIVALLDL
jgi:hypothetical protein